MPPDHADSAACVQNALSRLQLHPVKLPGIEIGRAIPLKVKGAFHSPFMKAAAESFAEELEKAETKERSITLYSNMTAEVYTDDVVGLLSKQICSPVQWEKIIRNMIADGVDTFIEIGPGKTLTNMIKKIDAEVKAVSVNDYLAEVDVY